MLEDIRGEDSGRQSSLQSETVRRESVGGIANFAFNGILHDQLDTLVADYGKQTVELSEACRRLRTYLGDATDISDAQRDIIFDRCIGYFEQAIIRRRRDQRGIERGEIQKNEHQGANVARAFGTTDREGGFLINQGDKRRRAEGDEFKQRNKRPRNIEDDHDPRFAWNWQHSRGHPPWDLNAALTTAQKTHQLRNVYNLDEDEAVQSLLAQGNTPPFPQHLWEDVLCDRHVNLAATIEDHNSQLSSDSSDSMEPPPMKTRPVQSQTEWLLAFDKYKHALLWAYPHRRDELDEYYAHIIFKFASCVDHSRVINYDSAVRKFVHERPNLTLADTHEFLDLAFSHLHDDGAAHRANMGTYVDGSKPKGKQGRRKGGKGSMPICGRFNSRKGCSFDPCRFGHICKECGGNHPKFQCGTK